MKALAILEGPESLKLPGWRHVMTIVEKGYPLITLSQDGGRAASCQMGVPHFPAGSWELPGIWPGFPLPRPEILTEIKGAKQEEMNL
jgi:hypothetical protein